MAAFVATDGPWIDGGGMPRDPMRPEPMPEPEYGVLWAPVRCPRCKSKRGSVYSTMPDGTTRYHQCKDCGMNFKSMEVVIDPNGMVMG